MARRGRLGNRPARQQRRRYYDRTTFGDGCYLYDGENFTALALTDEQQEAQDVAATSMNITIESTLMNEASQIISVFQDAVDLEVVTDEETKALPLWKKHRVLLRRTNAEISTSITWPDKPAY